MLKQAESESAEALRHELKRLRARISELESLQAEDRAASSAGERDAALRESEERFRTICQNAPVMIDSFDDSGVCTLWNRECERRLGWTQAEVAACPDPLRLFYPDEGDRNRVLEAILRADGRFREYRVVAKDGTVREQLWANFRLPAGALIAVGHDVTERRLIEEQLRQSQKMEAVGRFSGGIAHDFNNLLTVILLNAEILEHVLRHQGEAATRALDGLQRAANQGVELIRRLLRFTRRQRLAFEPVQVGQLLEELIPTLRRLLPETISVELDVDSSLPAITADPGALQQIVLNLATNARDAMTGGGGLQVRAQRHQLPNGRPGLVGDYRPGWYLAIAVTDTGEGMSESIRRRVFEPFFTTKAPGEGTGLGMPMVYGLVEQHHGVVRVESVVGQGTTVEVFLPLENGVRLSTAPGVPLAEPPTGTETILVVEDEALIRTALKTVLERQGYTVLLARDGLDALSVLEAPEPTVSLVISDVIMPRMTGPALHEAAKVLNPSLQFLFMSGYAEHKTGDGPSLDPNAAFLQKPWRRSHLLVKVRKLLDGRA